GLRRHLDHHRLLELRRPQLPPQRRGERERLRRRNRRADGKDVSRRPRKIGGDQAGQVVPPPLARPVEGEGGGEAEAAVVVGSWWFVVGRGTYNHELPTTNYELQSVCTNGASPPLSF